MSQPSSFTDAGHTNRPTSGAHLLALTDQCVKCAICLPHCPTYAEHANEADSPRGRIALVQGWLGGELQLTAALERHLDGCLLCLACERACPSLVQFGQIMDGARALQHQKMSRWRRLSHQAALECLSRASWMRGITILSRFYRISGLARLARLSGLARLRRLAPLHRLALTVPDTADRIPSKAEPLESADTRVDLFLGCMGETAQGAAGKAALQIMQKLGMTATLTTPAARGRECCGALLRHNGYADAADRKRNACAMRHTGQQLVGLSSACVAELRNHPILANTAEICAFIDTRPWPSDLRPRPLHRRVLVHEPCSHRSLPAGNAAVYRLLALIPGLDIAALPGNAICCGAAGTYLLSHPETAERMVHDKLAAVSTNAATPRADIIVTTNAGCALHLAAGCRQAALAVQVCHPIELLAGQLRSNDHAELESPSGAADNISSIQSAIG